MITSNDHLALRLHKHAYDVIEQGWIQRATFTPSLSPSGYDVCLVGGMLVSMSVVPGGDRIRGRFLPTYLKPLFDEITKDWMEQLGCQPTIWNDQWGRTKDEVLAFVAKQIDRYRNEILKDLPISMRMVSAAPIDPQTFLDNLQKPTDTEVEAFLETVLTTPEQELVKV